MSVFHYRMYCRGAIIDCKQKSFLFLIQLRFARFENIFFLRICFDANILKLSQKFKIFVHKFSILSDMA